MRALLLALSAPFLMAQAAHYEGVTLVHRLEVPLDGVHLPRSVSTLAFTGPDLRTRSLDLPPELDGSLGSCTAIAHHQGTTWALGRLHAHLPQRPALRGLAQRAEQGLPWHLYTSRDGRAWAEVATLPGNAAKGVSTFLPLGEDRFLLQKHDLFWQGIEVSPFAVFVREGRRLRMERLLGLDGPLYRAVPLPPGTPEAQRFWLGPQATDNHPELAGGSRRWHVQRLPAGILVVHGASGRWFLLEGRGLELRRQGHLWAPGEAEVTCVAARPDGQALVVAQRAADRPGPEILERLPGNAMPSDPGAALLVHRCQALEARRPQVPPVFRWIALDPAAGRQAELAPPRDFPPALDALQLSGLRVLVQPDGRLRLVESPVLDWFLHIPSRRWIHRLLQPFRLPFRRS